MRPDDRFDPRDSAFDALLDADLAGLDAELASAGASARRARAGQARPTAAFAGRLRHRLLAGLAAGDAAPSGAWQSQGQPTRGNAMPHLVEPGEAWAPMVLSPRVAGRVPAPAPRARWMLVAAAALSLVMVSAALGVGLSRLLPSPQSDPTATPLAVAVATSTPSASEEEPVIVTPTDPATHAPGPTEASTPATSPTTKPAPTPTPAPTTKPTTKPEPTKPPIGPMDLGLKACPGGVFIDWTKPSPDVAHYHVLRSLGADVPATYPADGTTDVETATSWSAGVTDGFDATVDGGQTATYRAFAFDASDNLLAWSPSRTVTTVGRIDLGSLVVEAAGAGSIDVSWAVGDFNLACFTYGKLVASEEDPDPSYVKGSPYLVAIGDPGATGTHLDGLPSGTTVWMRFEIIRVTSLGKFVVARTDAVQVTYP